MARVLILSQAGSFESVMSCNGWAGSRCYCSERCLRDSRCLCIPGCCSGLFGQRRFDLILCHLRNRWLSGQRLRSCRFFGLTWTHYCFCCCLSSLGTLWFEGLFFVFVSQSKWMILVTDLARFRTSFMVNCIESPISQQTHWIYGNNSVHYLRNQILTGWLLSVSQVRAWPLSMLSADSVCLVEELLWIFLHETAISCLCRTVRSALCYYSQWQAACTNFCWQSTTAFVSNSASANSGWYLLSPPFSRLAIKCFLRFRCGHLCSLATNDPGIVLKILNCGLRISFFHVSLKFRWIKELHFRRGSPWTCAFPSSRLHATHGFCQLEITRRRITDPVQFIWDRLFKSFWSLLIWLLAKVFRFLILPGLMKASTARISFVLAKELLETLNFHGLRQLYL